MRDQILLAPRTRQARRCGLDDPLHSAAWDGFDGIAAAIAWALRPARPGRARGAGLRPARRS